jgi:hypothetical protein
MSGEPGRDGRVRHRRPPYVNRFTYRAVLAVDQLTAVLARAGFLDFLDRPHAGAREPESA